MEKIKIFGFDMDYTLAVYKSPQYEKLGYDLIIDHLIKQGYPSKLANYSFDSSFVVRGLLFDRKMGNLLKIDGFGNILVAWHGFSPLNYDKLRDSYPNKFINKVRKMIFQPSNAFRRTASGSSSTTRFSIFPKSTSWL